MGDNTEEAGRSLEHEALSGQIIGAAISIHRALGPGFAEAIYDNALTIEFEHQGIPFQHQPEFHVHYRGREVGRYRPDFLVCSLIVVELKVAKTLADIHFAVVRSYLRASGCRHGLLLNFARPRLEIRRVVTVL